VLYRNRTGKLPCAKIAVNNNARWQHKSSPALIKWSDDNPTHPSNTDRMLLQQVSSFRAYCVQGRDTREQRKDVLYERWVVEYKSLIAYNCQEVWSNTANTQCTHIHVLRETTRRSAIADALQYANVTRFLSHPHSLVAFTLLSGVIALAAPKVKPFRRHERNVNQSMIQ